MSFYTFTPNSSTVYWLNPEDQEKMLQSPCQYSELQAEAVPEKERKIVAEKSQVVKEQPINSPQNKYMKELDAWSEHRRSEMVDSSNIIAKQTKKIAHKNMNNVAKEKDYMDTFSFKGGCAEVTGGFLKLKQNCKILFEDPEEAQMALFFLIAVLIGFFIGKMC